jgi:hemerythrin-like domain-containing protein
MADAKKGTDVAPGRLSRRNLLVLAGLAGAGILAPACAEPEPPPPAAGESTTSPSSQRGETAATQSSDSSEEDVTPAEDLMREHGVLRRILLVYGEAIRRVDARQDFPAAAVRDAAGIVRLFVEDYHEKLEEDYLFPRFEKAGTLADLTKVLRDQHEAGRRLTDRITRLAAGEAIEASSAGQLKELLQQFVRMYGPHAAREDTVLFPALPQAVSRQDLQELGEQFEEKEHDLFGESGFEQMVGRVASIEKTLGIYDLAQFTPNA